MKERWREYVCGMFEGGREQVEQGEIRDEEVQVDEVTEVKLRQIITKLNNNKSPGQNGITAGNIKYATKDLLQRICELIVANHTISYHVVCMEGGNYATDLEKCDNNSYIKKIETRRTVIITGKHPCWI